MHCGMFDLPQDLCYCESQPLSTNLKGVDYMAMDRYTYLYLLLALLRSLYPYLMTNVNQFISLAMKYEILVSKSTKIGGQNLGSTGYQKCFE